MAVPVRQNAVFTTGGSSLQSTLVVTLPSGISTGETLLIFIANGDNTNVQQFNDDVSGWSLIGETGNSTSDVHVAVYWRIADGTEGSTVTITSTSSDKWLAWADRVSGAHATTPIEVSAFSQDTGNTTSHAVGGVTTSNNDCYVYYFLAFQGGDGDPFSVSGTGWAELDEQQTDVSTISGVSACYGSRALTSAGASGTATVTSSASDTAAWCQVAIRPSAGGDTNVNTGTASLSLTTYPATISVDRNILAGVASLSYTTYPATISITSDTEVNAGVASLSFTTYPATISVDVEVVSNTQTLNYTTYPALVSNDVEVITGTANLLFDTYPADISLDRNINANVVSLTFTTYPATITTAVPVAGIFWVDQQMIVKRTETAAPLWLSVDNTGGVTGLTVNVQIRDGVSTTSYLDFNDDTFKISGWTQKNLALTEVGGGHYTATLDLTAIVNLPSGNHLALEYAITGSVTGVANGVLTMDDALSTGKYIGLRKAGI